MVGFDTPCMLRVIVTPAVYWSFAPLNRVFRYQYWAGFSGRSQPFDLAPTCVFIKQSERPGHCDQPLARLAPLIPKVQGKFAEFPRPDYRRHALGFSPRGTCVSSWYGRTSWPHRVFHGHQGSIEEGPAPLPLAFSSGSRHDGSPRSSTLGRAGEHARSASMRRAMGRDLHGAGILTRFPFHVLG